MNATVFVAALAAVIIFDGSAAASKIAASAANLSLIFVLASTIIMCGVVLAFRAR
jgi:hypothetical protein